ncbi:patatin-like phospholipase/acyl hydrolase [Hephaestia caeni]|uniref:Patatin-like phospholipase/acyl hydrolase n=2 Tax=Hephaestia caeni TaxID=645617 RepID=A0A397PGR1_9SPHN|nr:patatin-like phospholipase/acyl hydrolase [Hephaestia caeni]
MARFTTAVLERLQDWRSVPVGGNPARLPVREAFEVMAGTSAGALCVAGLLMGRTPAELSAMFDEEGPKIFPDRGWRGKLRWAFKAKYERGPLEDAVARAMGDADPELGELDGIVAFPAIDETNGQPVVFTNVNPVHRSIKLRDAVLASASAPTYFPAHRIAQTGRRYVDGGLYANAPDLCAVMIARQTWPHLALSDLHLVSIGTTAVSLKSPYGDDHPGAAGLLSWATRPPARLLTLAMRSQTDHVMDLLPQMDLADFIRIDALLDAAEQEKLELDNASAHARQALARAGVSAVAALDSVASRRLRTIIGRQRWSA